MLTLIGRAGRDAFLFDTNPNISDSVDVIKGFNVKADTIHLDNKADTKLVRSGDLKAAAFWKSSQAHGSSDRVITTRVHELCIMIRMAPV